MLRVVASGLVSKVRELSLDVPFPQLAERQSSSHRPQPDDALLREAPGPRLRLSPSLRRVRPGPHAANAFLVPLDAHKVAAGVLENADAPAARTKLGDRLTPRAQVPLLSRAARRPASRAARVLARCEMTSIR